MSDSRSSRSEEDRPSTSEIVGMDPESLDPSEEGVVDAGRQGLTVTPGPTGASVDLEVGARGLTRDGRFRTGRLAGLSMGAAIWVLSWPVLLESFLNSLVGLTDTALAAGLGEAETDAIGGASYIMWFIGLIIMALGVGATALISRSIGAGRMAVANAVLGQTVLLAFIAGVATGLFVAVAASPVSTLLNLTPEASKAFDQYMIVIAMGVPSASVLFALIACARGAGDARRPLYAMVVRNIVNVVVSWALSGVRFTRTDIGPGGELIETVILDNPFPFDLGVIGIGIGTVAGDIAGMLVVLVMAARGTWGIRLLRRRLRPHWLTVKRLVRLGVPNFLETFGMWVGNFFVIIMVGWLAQARETDGGLLGAHVVAIRIEAFSFLPGFAMGMAAATLCGQYLGAGAPHLARRAVLLCMAIAAVVMGAFGAAFVLFPEQIVGLLSRQQTHLEQTPALLVICGLVQIPFAVGIVFRAAMRGAGDVKVVMAMTWFTTYGLRLPLAYFCSGVEIPLPEFLGGGFIPNPSPFEPSLAGLWIGLCIELVLRGALFSGRFIHGGWSRIKV